MLWLAFCQQHAKCHITVITELFRHTIMILSFRTDRSGQTVALDQTAPEGTVSSGSTQLKLAILCLPLLDELLNSKTSLIVQMFR